MSKRKLYIIDPIVLQLYERGLSAQQIADEFGVTEHGVRAALKREGVVMRHERRATDEATVHRLRVIKAMRAAGATYQDIADELGVSRQAVNQLEKAHSA